MQRPTSEMSADTRRRLDAVRWHHTFEIIPGVKTAGTYDPEGLWRRLRLGEELNGKRLLDLGTRDGYFSFRCEELGAEVTAVDYVDKEGTGFGLAAELRASKVKFLHRNIYDIRPSEIGRFDYVLMLGLLYHLPDPYLALETVRSFVNAGGVVFVECTCIDERLAIADPTTGRALDEPILLFAARNHTSFWDLNSKCLHQLLEHTGFAVTGLEKWGKRMLAKAIAIDNPMAARTNKIARSTVDRG
jgi:tRNA (mo5U34)-methyltransferase